jgi:hypothetical protein
VACVARADEPLRAWSFRELHDDMLPSGRALDRCAKLASPDCVDQICWFISADVSVSGKTDSHNSDAIWTQMESQNELPSF